MSQGIHILYVDDEPDISSIACMALQDLGGYLVTACSSGQLALEHLAKTTFNLMIIDVMMPGLSGIETIQRARSRGLELPPFAFITAKVGTEQRQHYFDLGCVGVIAKPFDPMAISKIVKSILEAPQSQSEFTSSRVNSEQKGKIPR